MKFAFVSIATVALAIVSFSVSAPMLSSGAYANKMNGKGMGCSDRMCLGINSPKYGKQKNIKPGQPKPMQ